MVFLIYLPLVLWTLLMVVVCLYTYVFPKAPAPRWLPWGTGEFIDYAQRHPGTLVTWKAIVITFLVSSPVLLAYLGFTVELTVHFTRLGI